MQSNWMKTLNKPRARRQWTCSSTLKWIAERGCDLIWCCKWIQWHNGCIIAQLFSTISFLFASGKMRERKCKPSQNREFYLTTSNSRMTWPTSFIIQIRIAFNHRTPFDNLFVFSVACHSSFRFRFHVVVVPTHESMRVLKNASLSFQKCRSIDGRQQEICILFGGRGIT